MSYTPVFRDEVPIWEPGGELSQFALLLEAPQGHRAPPRLFASGGRAAMRSRREKAVPARPLSSFPKACNGG